MTNLTRRHCPRCNHVLYLDDFDLVWQSDGTRTLSALCSRCEKQSRTMAALQAGNGKYFRRSAHPVDERFGAKNNRPPDKGCTLAPSCLSCPLPACIWDTPVADQAIVREIWKPDIAVKIAP